MTVWLVWLNVLSTGRDYLHSAWTAQAMAETQAEALKADRGVVALVRPVIVRDQPSQVAT